MEKMFFSNKMLGGMILLDVVIFAIIWLVFIKIRNRKRPKDDKGYDPFYFEGENFVLNNPVRKWSCEISDIECVKFTYKKVKFGIYDGIGEIVRKSEGSQKFLFTGSVYSRKPQTFTNKEEILKSIEVCKNILSEKNIPCVVEE